VTRSQPIFSIRITKKMVEVLHGAGIVESINQAHLVAASEPVYGPNGEKKTQYFADI